jgi:EAL domain-containing protein (putative c-di-GMP-specific phosphodiesterase class I)
MPHLKPILHLLLAVSGLFSLPVHAAIQTLVLSTTAIAFVLGFSLCFILSCFLLRSVLRLNYIFVLSFTLIVTALLYALNYAGESDSALISAMAAAYLTALAVLPRFNKLLPEVAQQQSISHVYILCCSAFSYWLLLWFIPALRQELAWLGLTSVAFIISLIKIRLCLKAKSTRLMRVIGQCLLMLAYCAAIYFWLNAQLSLTALMLVVALSFIVSLLNINQGLVTDCLVNSASKNIETTELDQDSFSYPYDPATNLPCYEQALHCFERQLRSVDDPKFAVLIFAPINFQQDDYLSWRKNSDILLLQLSYCLQQQAQDKPMLVNFGSTLKPMRLARSQQGHFLAVIDLNTSKHPEKAVIDDICHQLSAAVPKAINYGDFSLNFELAFGVAINQTSQYSARQLIASASNAQQDAVQQQTSICYFNPSEQVYGQPQVVKMQQLKQDIHNQQIRWYLQPQIALTDKTFIGFELKAHWYGATKQPQELEQFVALAEHSGDLYCLTKQMFNQACEQILQLQHHGVDAPVSVTLARCSLLEPDLVEFLAALLQSYNIAAKYLMVQLSETLILSVSKDVKITIDHLRALGIAIAITDFSGSYQALGYLRKLSVNQIKVNCSRLGNNAEERADKAIINAIINLTRTMELSVIGSDINSADSEKAFVIMGGQYAQGNMISRGVVPDQLEIWLKRWSESLAKH